MFETVQESEQVCTTGMYSRTLYAQHPVSPRIFRSLPGSRLRFFIAGQIQHPTVHIFLYTPAQIDAPCRLEPYYVLNIKLKTCVIVLHSTGPLSRMYSSSTFYAQNPALEIVDQQEERECLSTHTCTRGMFSKTNPLCAASCVTNIRTSLPGSHSRFFIAMQIQYSCEHTFVQQY